jgi:hypothetical protein
MCTLILLASLPDASGLGVRSGEFVVASSVPYVLRTARPRPLGELTCP